MCVCVYVCVYFIEKIGLDISGEVSAEDISHEMPSHIFSECLLQFLLSSLSVKLSWPSFHRIKFSMSSYNKSLSRS